METKSFVHFTDSRMLNPTNPITVNLIGAGGTGSNMIANLGRLNYALTTLGHPGLHVTLWDDDAVTAANCGRQLFMTSEIGLNKAVARINNINRAFGTNWKAIPRRFEFASKSKLLLAAMSTIYISCVDRAATRFKIAEILVALLSFPKYQNEGPLYWMDFGNSKASGQVFLSTLGKVEQPNSLKYVPVGTLPLITEEYRDLLLESDDDQEPSCSLAEALERQDLFINSSLAHLGSSLLWSLFRKGMTHHRGFFLNLDTLRAEPIPIAISLPAADTDGNGMTKVAA